MLVLKLLPFAKQHGLVVQEDGAGAHVAHQLEAVFDLWGVVRLLWPSNLPDLNMIEPA